MKGSPKVCGIWGVDMKKKQWRALVIRMLFLKPPYVLPLFPAYINRTSLAVSSCECWCHQNTNYHIL